MTMLLEARGLRKTFEGGDGRAIDVLTGTDLSVARGEFVAIVGASGAGKSTLRLAPPLVVDEGDVDTALAIIDGLLGELD